MNVAGWKAIKSWSETGENARLGENARFAEASRQTCDVLLVITHLTPGGSLEVLNLMAEELRKQGLSVQTVALYRGVPAAGTEHRYHLLDDRERLDWLGYAKSFIRLAMYMRSTGASAIIGFMPVAN